MKKTTAYARKRRHAGTAFNGAEWMNTINRVRPYDDAPLPGFFETKDAAQKSEVVVRRALQSLLDCVAPDDTCTRCTRARAGRHSDSRAANPTD